MAAKPHSGIAWYRRFYFVEISLDRIYVLSRLFLDKIKKNVETLLEVIPVLREESRQFFFVWRERSRHYIFFVEHHLDRNILKSDQKQIQILSFSGPTQFATFKKIILIINWNIHTNRQTLNILPIYFIKILRLFNEFTEIANENRKNSIVGGFPFQI